MKHRFLLLFLLCCIHKPPGLQAQCNQWQPVPSGTSQLLRAVHFADPQNGWATGSGGTLLRSQDGGATWADQSTALGAGGGELYGVHFSNATTGWVVGAGGFVKKTTNGGGAWSVQTVNTATDLYDVYFTDANTGWIAGACGLLLRTTNGGALWQTVSSGQNYHITGVASANGNNVSAATSGAVMLQSGDLGATWSPASGLSGDRNFRALAFAGATGWAANTDGKIWKSTNGGATWLYWGSAAPFTGAWQSASATAGYVYIAGLGGRLVRSSGSAAFDDFSDGIASEDLYGLYMLNDDRGWAVGAGGKIFRYVFSNVPPNCLVSIPLHQQTNVPIDTKITWPRATGCPTGYRLSLGSTPGGSDILNNQIMADTFYQPAQPLPAGQTIYVRITPYNGAGQAAGCGEFWFVTTSMIPCDAQSDSTELVKFYDVTGGMNWTNKWTLATPVNTWHGVTVNGEGCVTRLALENNNLVGVIPDINLPYLQDFWCTSNKLTNTIPDFSNLPNLSWFNCFDNYLTGTIPNFTKLPKLKRFTCSYNDLIDTIPNFDKLPNLEWFDCTYNLLTGAIPNFDKLPNLKRFDCHNNKNLSGTIPNFDKLPKLEVFTCDYNSLSGGIPNFDKIPNLKEFRCSFNNLSEAIPSFDNLPNLQLFNCENNQFVFENILSSKGQIEATILSNCVPGPFCIYDYAPQDSVFHDTLLLRNIGENLDFSLDFDENVATNVYKWYQDGIYQPAYDKTGNNDLEINNVQATHAGEWRVQVTNPGAPGLTLYGRTIRLQIGCAVPAPPDLGPDLVLCAGTSGTLDAGPAASWKWSDGSTQQTLTVSAPGTYSVTVTDAGGCTGEDNVLVSIDNQGVGCGLVAHYNLDGDAQDAGGNGLHGQNFGAIPARDRFGNCDGAMYFNSSSINVPHDDRLNFAGDFSFAFWFRKEGATFGHIIGKGQDSQNSYYFTANNGPNQDFDAFSVYNTPQNTVLSIAPTAAQEWHHAVCIYDKTDMMLYLYVDGALAASESATSAFVFNNVHPLVLGRHCTNANGCGSFPYYFNGWIDDVRLYARALTPTDIAELYNLPDDNPNPAPAAALTASTPALCPGESVLLNAAPVQAGYTYAWYRDGNLLTGATGNTYTASEAGSYRVQVAAGAGCDSLSLPVTLTLAPPVVATIATPGGTLLTCSQTALALQASSGDTFAWSGNLGSSANATATAPGTYSVTVTDSATGCSATASATVTQSVNLPDASAAGGTLTCSDPVILLQGNSGTPGVTYAWTGPNGFVFNGQNPPVNLTGSYTLTVSNPANGCAATAVAIVSGDTALPSALISTPSGTQITCATNSVPLQAPAVAGHSYAWSGGLGNNASANTAMPGAYTVTVTNTANSCTATGSVTVTQNNVLPNVSASGGALTCAQPFVILQGASLTPGVSFQWSGPNGFASGQSNPPVNVAGTYALTVTNPQNGCTAGATTSVSQNNTLPVVSLSTPNGTAVTCALPFVPLNASASGPVVYAWSGPNGFSFNAPNPAVNVAGAYTVTVTNTTSSCSATASTTVSLNNTPPAAAVNLPDSSHLTCAQPTVVLEVFGGDSQNWSGPNGFTFNGSAPSVSLPGFYTVTVTNASNGCTAAVVVTVTQNKTTPNATAAAGTITCAQPAAMLQGLSSTQGVTWLWSGPGGFTSDVQNPAVSSGGTYLLTVTNPQNGCTATATATVQQNLTPPPVSVALPEGGQLTCAKPAVLLQAAVPGSNGYVWSGPSGFVFNGPAPAVNVAGPYTVVVTSLANGCTATATANITENKTPPVAGVTAPAGLLLTCVQSFVALQGTGGGTYAWAGPNGFQLSDPNASVNIAGLYTLTVTNPANGCTATTTADILEDKTPPVAAVSPANAQITCSQPSTVLQGSGGGSYSWAGPGGFASALQNPSISVGGTYVLTVTNALNGCTDTATVGVSTDQTTPGINAAGGQLSCQTGTAILLGGSDTPGAQLSWSGPGGFVFNGPSPSVNQSGVYTFTVTHPISGCTATKEVTVAPPLILTPAVSGRDKLCPGGTLTLTAESGFAGGYKWSNGATTAEITVNKTGDYTVTVTDGDQCTGTKTVVITLAELPEPAIAGPSILCSGSNITLDAGDGYEQYDWSGGQETQTITVDMAGPYGVVVTDTNGCTGSATAIVDIVASPIPGAGSNSPLCAGEQLKLFAGSGPGWLYTWTGPDGFNSSLQNPLHNAATAAMSGQYQIVVTNGNNCTGSATVDVQVADEILTEIDTVVCAGNTILDGKPATIDTTIQRIITSATGCDSLIVTTIQVIDESDLQAAADTAILLPDETALVVNLTDNDWLQTNWNLEILSTPDLRGDVQVLNDGEIRYRRAQGPPYSRDMFRYSVCAADLCLNVCDTADVSILVFNKTIVPNGFVPEGEKENQLFDPLAGLNEAAGPGMQVLPDDVIFLVFNRWGEIVYEAGPYVPWDGKQNNRILPQGTYYYRLLLKQSDEKGVWSEGPVHLLR